MESAGQRLKKIRLEKGLDLEEVHKRTKIHLNVLKAIEEDSLIGFNPIYIRGFLKIYCRFLGVNPDEYAGQQEKPLIKEVQEAPSVKSRPARPVFMPPMAVVPWKPIAVAAAAVILSLVLFNLGKFIAGGISSRVKKIALSDKKIKPRVVAVKPEGAQPKKYPIAGPDIRLGMRAKEDCWVDLKADGRVIFHGILRKGKFESWQAKDRIDFSLGNAGVIDLELNGRPIPPLGRKSQSVKRASITKDGLVIN